MKKQKGSLFEAWKRNFGKGIYVIVILGMAATVVQIAALLVSWLFLAAFPALDKLDNEVWVTVLSIGGFLIAGVPLFGFFFTTFYEHEEKPNPNASPSPSQ
jgi:hypothetical protein